jgi:hypothetical protein
MSFEMMKMVVGGLFGVLALVTTTGCCANETGGSGVSASRTETLAMAVHEIETKQVGAHIILDPKATGTEIVIHGDTNLVSLVRTRVNDGKLLVDVGDDDSVRPNLPLEIVIRMPRLTSVHAEQSADVDIDVGLVPNAPLQLEAWSASRIVARGVASNVEIDLQGSSEVDARDLIANDVEVDANGASTAYVCARGTLDVSLNGASQTMYSRACRPRDIDKDVSGSSQLFSL